MAFETINLGTQPAGTGGDTARSAFEKTNRNFLAAEVLSAAMSQAQFEAIREQNKEKYAASGFVHFGKHYVGNPYYIPINEGLWTNVVSPNNLQMGKASAPTPIGKSSSAATVVHISGVIFTLSEINTASENQSNIKFPQAPNGKTTYNKSTGAITTYATTTEAFNAQAADPTYVEVVINRVDMWGFEAWPEEVTSAKPFIYPNGLIQSKATNMSGVPTIDGSDRPESYYAMFTGDITSKGTCVNFFTLSDAQKKKVLADPKNNLYFADDGQLVQWRLRVRSFAGAGNGDWRGIASNDTDGIFGTSDNSRFLAQGMHDSTASIGNDGIGISYLGFSHPAKTKNQDRGIFSGRHASLSAIAGECYFLVCGTVNRLNQGAYHLSFNPNGTAYFSQIGVNVFKWHQLPNQSIDTIICFTPATASSIGYRGGDISSGIGLAGRPDERYYDAIYASGQGGVCRDMRYLANGVDATDSSEVDQIIKNGTYRGFEKIKLTTASSSVDINVSVGGNFLVTEVIAASSVINATPALSSGWYGVKNAQQPTGSISVFELSRYAITAPTALRSTNNGASWSVFTPTYNAVSNSVTLTNEPAANILILQYQAFARQTENAPNAALAGPVPYNVFASSDYRTENGAQLGESLIGKVLKNNSGVSVNNKSLSSCAIDGTGKLTSASNFDWVTHQAITLGAPANNSPAFKAVSYLANINQQAVPHFAFTELKHNGTNWGDDGKVTIVDNQATKTDLNGNTVLVGTAKLKEPIGWIKNKV